MNAHEKGLLNQRKSKTYILSHPELYGIPKTEPHRVHICHQSNYSGDLFSFEYGVKIDRSLWHGEPDKIPPRPKAGWDIITMPDFADISLATYKPSLENEEFPIMDNYIHLIQVKTNWTVDGEYLSELIEFDIPFYVKKELHNWLDLSRVPIIYKLNQK